MTDRRPARTVSAQDLVEHAALLNSYRFSTEFGWQWFVRSEETPGGTVHSLERRDVKSRSWKPDQGQLPGVRSTYHEKGTML